jgi:hypothetical protein
MKRPPRKPSRAAGQAMVELAIIGALFLVPLFLLIPLLGKQIDIKHSAIQAARYEAWEYTAWYSANSERPDGFHSPSSQPVKGMGTAQREARRRFFSDPRLPITAADSGGWNTADQNVLWRTHAGLALYEGDIGTDSAYVANASTPDPTGIFTGVIGAIDVIFEALAQIASFLDLDVGFTAINTKGYFHTRVAIPTEEVPGLFPATTVVAQAGVLADGWNAGGKPHAEFQVGGIVPTKALGELLEKTPLKEIISVVSIFAPELRPCDPSWPWPADDPGSLWLGHIDFDTVHPDRLDGSNSDGHACDEGGFCDFDPAPARTATLLGPNLCAFVP